MTVLRTALDTLTQDRQILTAAHPEEIERLGQTVKHSIRLVSLPRGFPYNCFAYALGVQESRPIINILRRDASLAPDLPQHADVKFGTEFMEKLMSSGILQADPDGELIVYFCADRPVHGGLMHGTRVTSKWGIGCLWNHEIWEVPLSYGMRTERYRRVEAQTVEAEFDKYYQELVAGRD